ncbi:MAG: competence/damage-inducible protein A [Ignavibacteria bacterium]|jgi:nicotinamide-nucleotide amidase
MKAYIISIGDEILIGQTVNTNAAYISSKLVANNIHVDKTVVVGDNYYQIMKEFQVAFEECDLVIVTGGLGPTHDDITRRCVVDFFETELIQNDSVLEDIKNLFSKKGRELTEINREQALVPKIATPIKNYSGTAPGIWIEKSKKYFAVFPGVPYEMEEMVDDFLIPKMQELLSDKKGAKVIKNILTTGIPESTLYEKIGNIDELLDDSKLAFLPNQYGVKLRLTVESEDKESANNKLLEIEQKLRGKIGRYIYGKEDDTLESVIAKIITERGLTIATAESCTGGLVANRLTNVSGSSKFFERGVVAYSNAAKVELLKVNEDTIQENGAVSIEVARQMAEGVKAISCTDIGLSTTGIMGPTGASGEKKVGLVYVGLCDEKICTAKKFTFGDDRLLNKDRTSQAALELLRRHLLGISYDE